MLLKIGLVTGEYPPMEGGVGAYTQELAKALAQLGHQVHIITSHEARSEPKTRKFWDPQKPVDLGYAYLHPLINRWWWSATSRIARIAVDNDLNVVNLQYQAVAYSMRVPAINFLPWRLRELTKTIVTFHDLRHPYLFPKAGRFRPAVVRHLAFSAEGVIVTNREDYLTLADRGLDKDKLARIPIGSNIRAIIPSNKAVLKIRNQLGLENEDQVLGYFGFVNSSKGADILIRALSKLPPNIHLLFIGAQTGSSDPKNNETFHSQLIGMINELGIGGRVHWSGFLADEDVSACMHVIDLMVLPYRDGVSLRRGTLMATLAHGRPLLSTYSTSQLPELINGQNVWLVAVDDPDALKDAIDMLLADPERRTRLGEGALAVADCFTWDKIAQSTVSFYNQIVS
jgi:glycosyltransferase involved in cell wall biosynthesis